jgi:hypothetical protein
MSSPFEKIISIGLIKRKTGRSAEVQKRYFLYVPIYNHAEVDQTPDLLSFRFLLRRLNSSLICWKEIE